MQVISPRSRGIKSRPGESSRFTGQVVIDDVITGQDKGLSVGRVTFGPGSRTHWHRHPAGQVLYVVSGVGRIGAAGPDLAKGQQEAREIGPGDVIWAPANEWHWHGAGPHSFMTHIAGNLVSPDSGPGQLANNWDREVTQAEYEAAAGNDTQTEG